MTEHEDNDVGELVDSVPADQLRIAFASAIAEIMHMLAGSPVCDIAAKEVMAAEERVRERLARRILN